MIKRTDKTNQVNPDVPRLITPQADEVIVATLFNDDITINAGETASYQLTLLNNGTNAAFFSLYVEGWIDEAWVKVYPVHTRLEQGERASLSIDVSPPRQADSLAGTRELALIIRSPEYPNRVCRLRATLTINPFTELMLGDLRPRQVTATWRKPTAMLMVPVANQGNTAAVVRLRADDFSRNQTAFIFGDPQDLSRPRNQTKTQPAFQVSRQARAGQMELRLPAGKSAIIPLQIRPHVPSIFGIRRTRIPLRVRANTVTRKTQHTPHPTASSTTRTQMVNGHLLNVPFIGPWQLASLTGFSLVAIVTTFFLILFAAMTIWFNQRIPTQASVAPIPVELPTPAPSIPLAIIVKVAEPVPESIGVENAAPEAVGIERVDVVEQPIDNANGVRDENRPNPPIQNSAPDISPPAPSSVSIDGGGGIDGIPIVQADAVTAPGEPVPSQARRPQSTLAQRSEMSYEEMFREIGLIYDINWQLLAAQAYVESSLDPLALGRDGELGLMQILPPTWREWSPTVGVNDPFDSYSNALVAAVYLDYLRTYFGEKGYPEQAWMLVAYNWGPNRLQEFLERGEEWTDLPEMRRQYAIDVLRIAESIPE
ncbi:MAG: transglycosylase SLT domain-containing protein [Chloroflexota bacterium]